MMSQVRHCNRARISCRFRNIGLWGMGSKHIAVTTFTFQGHVTSSVTWPLDSPCVTSCWRSIGSEPVPLSIFGVYQTYRGHSVRHMQFPIGAPLYRSRTPAVFEICPQSNMMASRPWPFMVTWRHQSRDDSILHMPFPIGGPSEPSPYLQALSRYSAPKRLSSVHRNFARAISRDMYSLYKI